MIKRGSALSGAILLFCFLPSLAGALDMESGAYGDISEFLDGVYGADNNAGLTAFPVLNVPIGGRSEGMASSFAAVSDDISFIEFNPAGSSMLSHSELAFFHNNWIADTKVEGLAWASRYKNFGFAASGKWLYTPFTEYNLFGDRVSRGYYSEAVAILNGSYNFLSGYYFSGISVGASLKGAFRFMPDFTDDEDNIIAGSGQSQSAVMAMADVGVLTRFDFLKPYNSRERNMSAALVVRNLGPPAQGDPLPTAAVAALSYKPLRPLLFSFDFSVPLNLAEPALSEKPYWAAGVSVQATSFLSMRTGIMAKAGNVRITVGSAVNLAKIALDVNYTLDLLTQLQPMNRVSLGVRLDMGDQGRKQASDRVDALYLMGLDSYAGGNYQEAEYYWTETLKLDPKFAPAKEGLMIISRSKALQDRIDGMQVLDL
jgi:hypothetical protein